MTAEERMAYFQGTKRRVPEYTGTGRAPGLIFLKIKFSICMILFVAFLSLDYTGMKVKGYGSAEIIQAVTEDLSFDTNALQNFLKALNIA